LNNEESGIRRDRGQRTVLVVLVLLLLVNLLVWSNLRQLSQRADQLQGQLNALQSSVTHEVGSIRGELQAARQQEHWWSPVDLQLEAVDGDRVRVEVSWSLQEYREGSEVMLHYSAPGETVFQDVPAERGPGGHFSAAFTVDVPLEPPFDVSLQVHHSGDQRRTSVVEEMTSAYVHGGMDVQYFISVQEGDTVKTGLARTLDLGKFRFDRFNPLHARVEIDAGQETVRVTLSEWLALEMPHYAVEKVLLEQRDSSGSRLDGWEMIVVDEGRPRGGQRIYEAEAPIEATETGSLYCLVHYTDSLVVEKSIYTNVERSTR